MLLPKEEYDNIINHIKKISQKKTAHDYYHLKKYEILQCGNVEKLIRKREDGEQNPIYFVTIEEMFDAIKQVHINTGHRSRDKMIITLLLHIFVLIKYAFNCYAYTF